MVKSTFVWDKAISIFMYNKIKELIMSLVKRKEILDLSQEELEFLLKLIADSKFEGKDVQLVYGSAVKLQKMLTE